MLDKCANPECQEKLVHLRSGAMYSIDFPMGESHASGRPQFFWLCEGCSGKHKLCCDGTCELKLVSLNTPDPACRPSCSKIRTQRIAKRIGDPAPGALFVLHGRRSRG
jgi:hypothetical protein